MKKVICFARVSSTKQDLETQKVEVLKAIKNDGFRANEIAIVEGKESAIKKDEEERQTLNEMKQLIDGNPSITDVYFYAIDRLARKVSIVLSIVDKMTGKGVNLHFLNPYPMQTMRDGKEDSMGKMFLTFLSIGAEMEMKMKSERFKDTRAKMKEEGKLVVGKVLYGYFRDKQGFPQVKEDEAEVVRGIFRDYLSGKSMRQIAKDLIVDNKFDGSKLKNINSGIMKVSNIITNPAYSGRQAKQRDSKEAKNIAYPAIVSVEDQDEAIAISSANKREKETSNIYYAKGIVKTMVGEDELVMTPIKGNTSYCLNLDGSQINVNVNVIDYIAWATAKTYYNIYRSYKDLFQPNAMKEQIEEYVRKIDNLQPVLAKFDDRANRLTRLYKLGRMTDDEYDADYEAIMKEKQPFVNEVIKLQNSITKVQNEMERMNERRTEVIDLEGMTDEERRDLVKDMLEKIMVEKTGKYDYRITPIPSSSFLIGLAIQSYDYNCSGGKKRLTLGDKDLSDQIVMRYKAMPRKRKG